MSYIDHFKATKLYSKKQNVKQNKARMVFMNTMETILLETNKQHQSILGANSKEEFLERRARLESRSVEHIESVEDAASHKKRENRQVCAGTYRFGVCRVLILTLMVRFAQPISAIITISGRHFFISSTFKY